MASIQFNRRTNTGSINVMAVPTMNRACRAIVRRVATPRVYDSANSAASDSGT